MFGIIDSGFGGLSVIKELYKQQKKIDFIYFGDNFYNPYGTKKEKFIISRTVQIIEFLYKNYKIDNLIVACNTMSIACGKKIKKKFPYINIMYITETTLKYFKKISINIDIINVLATEFTIKSNFYANELKEYKTNSIDSQILVTLVEKNLDLSSIDKNELNLIKKKIQGKNLLLGCTHFYFLKDFFKSFIDDNIKIIDPSTIIVNNLQNLQKQFVYNKRILLTSGDLYSFKKFIYDNLKITDTSFIQKIKI